MKKSDDHEQALAQTSSRINREEIKYAIKIFFYSITLDNLHAVNIVYFLTSVAALDYNLLYCFMLLDFVAKIPVLQTVVQGIV